MPALIAPHATDTRLPLPLQHMTAQKPSLQPRGAGGSAGAGGARGGTGGASGASGGGKTSGSGSGGKNTAGSSTRSRAGSSNGSVRGGGNRNNIWHGSTGRGVSAPQGPFGYGYGRPLVGGAIPAFGFWPWYWNVDYAQTSSPTNDVRPGGPLLAAGITSSSGNSSQYVLWGDTESVASVLPAVLANCQAINASAPADLRSNVTLQRYRDDSFEMLRFDGAQQAGNASFESCVNQTIGDNLPIGGHAARPMPAMGLCLLAVVVGLGLA